MARFVNKLQIQQMKYMFQMTLHKLELHVPYDVSVMCVLKQGSRRLESETTATIGKGQPIADFKDEKLTIVNRVKKDKATKKFQDREGHIIVQIKRGEQTKSVGIVKVNLVDFIDHSNGATKNGIRQHLGLDKCPDKNAYLEFTLSSVLVQADANGTETISLASAAMSVDDGCDSEFNFDQLQSGVSTNGRQKRNSFSEVNPPIAVQIQSQPEPTRKLPLRVPILHTSGLPKAPIAGRQEEKSDSTEASPAPKSMTVKNIGKVEMSPAQKPVMQSTKVKSIQKVKLQTQSTMESVVRATPPSDVNQPEESTPTYCSSKMTTETPQTVKKIVLKPQSLAKIGSTVMRGSDQKESSWKGADDGTTPRTALKNSQMTAEQRQQLLEKIRGGTAISGGPSASAASSKEVASLKEKLQQAENLTLQLKAEKKNLNEKISSMQDQQNQNGDDLRAQLQSMLSQKQLAQDQLGQIENQLSRCTKERDKQTLIVTQLTNTVSDLKSQVKDGQDTAKSLQSKLSEATQAHLSESKRLKQEFQVERASLDEEKNNMETRLQEEAASSRESQSKVEQLLAQLELSNQKVERLNLDSHSQKSNVELRLKSQITQLEQQLDESSRVNHDFKRRVEQLEVQVQEGSADLQGARFELDRTQLKVTEQESLIERLQAEAQQAQETASTVESDLKRTENSLKEELATVQNKKEQLQNDMKSAAKTMKEKERKLGTLENKLKDMEDEQLILIEQHQEQLQSKTAIFQHQIEDSKRRQIELEDKVAQQKQTIEDLKLQVEAPTQDKGHSAVGKQGSSSEEVLALHEELTEIHSKMTMMENQNMESVALLKQENRKLQKQLKDSSSQGTGTSAKSGAASKNAQREIAALQIEHEELTAQVDELKQYLADNQRGKNGDQSVYGAGGVANDEQVEALQEELHQMQAENQDINEQLEELGIQYRSIEQQLVEAKLKAATLDMEADQLSVEVTNKNSVIKKFSIKCTKLEIELVQAQAQAHQGIGVSETSLEDGAETEYGVTAGGAKQTAKTPQPKGVSSKLKNFFQNKFTKKQGKGSTNSSAQNSAQADGVRNAAIGIQDMEEEEHKQ